MLSTLAENEDRIRGNMDPNTLRGQAACLLIGQYAVQYYGISAKRQFDVLLDRWPFRNLWHKAGEVAATTVSSFRRDNHVYNDEDLHDAFIEERWKALEDQLLDEKLLELTEVTDLMMFFEHDTSLSTAMERLREYREDHEKFRVVLRHSDQFTEDEVSDIRAQMVDICQSLPEIVIAGANAAIEEEA